MDPKPIQKPYLQLLFGGNGNRMLALAGKYGDIVYLSQRGDTKEVYDKKKAKVINSAKKNNRESKISFMSGQQTKMESIKDYVKILEDAKVNGNTYFMVSFNLEDDLKEVKDFAKEILPSFS